MKKEIETINKGQEEKKKTISELKHTVEGIKSNLDEAEDCNQGYFTQQVSHSR